MVAALTCLELQSGDELILADNTREGLLGGPGGEVGRLASRTRVVHAAAERSSYHARNAGAGAAGGGWILFLDADCTPVPDLLGAYFAEPVALDCGALAGQILGDPHQRSFAARYARSRKIFDHAEGLIRADGGGAGAGNLMVRRAAFERIAGFTEGIRSGGDLDLCRRLAADGWRLVFRPAAVVHHRHRETLPSLLGALARYGAGAAWLNRRHPGCSPPWPLRLGLEGAGRDAVAHLRRRRFEEAAFRAVDGLGLVAHRIGYAAGNEAPPARSTARG
jgi:GT2 family glycosyltransferase